MGKLTHLDKANRPAMVDVGAKPITLREAAAEAWVTLPPAVSRALRASGHRTRKGPVFDTAIIAGVQAAKRTHDLIPFCHPLPIERCKLDIEHGRGNRIHVVCEVAARYRTGVEMEALTGAAIAALTSPNQRRDDGMCSMAGFYSSSEEAITLRAGRAECASVAAPPVRPNKVFSPTSFANESMCSTVTGKP